MNNDIKIHSYYPGVFIFGWDWNQKGYGEFSVNLTEGGKRIEIWNDNLNKEEVKILLYEYVNYLIEHGEFKEFRKD